MHKRILFILIAGLMFTGTSVADSISTPRSSTTPSAVFEGGRLFKSGKINVVMLSGSHRQMGRQYGHLLSKELNHLFKTAIQEYFINQKGLSMDTLKQTAMSLYYLYPQRFKDVISGMAETSGLSADEQIILNAIELYGMLPACSAISAWKDYTGNQPLIIGRNYDWFESYADFAKNTTVTVFKPDSGVSSAIVTFAGVIYATTGINENGLFLELNNGLPSGGVLSYSNRVPAIINLLAFLSDYTDMTQLDAAFNTTRSNFAFIINAADKNTTWSYEWPPFNLRRRAGQDDGLLVSTNHFVDPEWGIILQDNAGFKSVKRRQNLLSMGREQKGSINPDTMKKILDTPIDQGGATWPSQGMIRTVYQVITVPEQLKIWIKVPGYQDWTDVNLKAIFALK